MNTVSMRGNAFSRVLLPPFNGHLIILRLAVSHDWLSFLCAPGSSWTTRRSSGMSTRSCSTFSVRPTSAAAISSATSPRSPLTRSLALSLALSLPYTQARRAVVLAGGGSDGREKERSRDPFAFADGPPYLARADCDELLVTRPD